MTLEQIKTAVEQGKTVHWQNARYEVIVDNRNQWLIKAGSHCIGLTWADGITLNGRESEFYIA